MPMDKVSCIEPAVSTAGTYTNKDSTAAAVKSVTFTPKVHLLQIEQLVVLCKLCPAVHNFLYYCSKCGQCGHTKDKIKISTHCPQKTDNSSFMLVVLAGCPFEQCCLCKHIDTIRHL